MSSTYVCVCVCVYNPEYWDGDVADGEFIVAVAEDSEEFAFVQDKFYNHGFRARIVSIQRVQNQKLWNRCGCGAGCVTVDVTARLCAAVDGDVTFVRLSLRLWLFLLY